MAKKKISAKQAVADIRSGMSDSALMKKFGLSQEGLESLYDKLVHAGFIDLAEIQGRLQGYFGTVVVSESAIGQVKREDGDGRPSPRTTPAPLINAQEAARDVRSRMDDTALMQKYRLTPKGLQSLFDKLLAAGLITQVDMDRRTLGIDHTVDLRELTLDYGDALAQLGLDGQKPGAAAAKALPDLPKRSTEVYDTPPKAAPTEKNNEEVAGAVKPRAEVSATPWFDKAFAVILLLMVFFPVGFYGLYRNSTFSRTLKVLLVVAWIALAIACLMLFSERMSPAHRLF